jgi:transposase
MKQFPDAQHLASWAGLCPGSHESAGKREGLGFKVTLEPLAQVA